jgi:hypothetical protein
LRGRGNFATPPRGNGGGGGVLPGADSDDAAPAALATAVTGSSCTKA